MTSTSTSNTLEAKKPSVRSSKPRRVYGKRTVASAVLDRASPASRRSRDSCEAPIDGSSNDSDDIVDSVQKELAGVSIDGTKSAYSRPEDDTHSHIPRPHEESTQSRPDDGCTPDSGESSSDAGDTQRAAAVVVPPKRSRSRRTTKSQRPKPPGDHRYVENQGVQSYARPILEQAVSPVASKGVQQFERWAQAAGDRFRIEKIAEGSYGEVYQLHLRDEVPTKREISQSKFSKLKAYDAGIFKVVPLCARKGPGSKKYTSVDEIVSEVRLLRLLDPVPGFVRFRDVHVVQGRFPEAYQDAWTKFFHTNKDECFNPDPGSRKSYPDTQLWAILEMDNAGYELEKFTCSSVSQIYDIFWNVALGLARAEQLSGFEHRDLHLGNICIKPRETEACSDSSLIVDEENRTQTGFGLSGVETTIIDYSLSRAESTPNQHTNSFGIAWSDLDKKKIFDAVGRDEEEKLLRDTYRRMRSHVYDQNQINEKRPPKDSKQWKSYNPGTNLIWLSFVLETLLKRYKPRDAPPPRLPLGERDPNRQIIGEKPDKLRDLKSAWSPSPTITPDSSILDDELEDGLLERLEALLGFLDVEKEENEFGCAGDLVATAIGLEWISESDFLC